MRSGLHLGLPILAALCWVWMAGGAQAQTIDTTPAWDGVNNISAWGNGHTPAFGQTITAPGGNLSSFTFYLRPVSPGGPQNYEARVYAWDALTFRATGPALFVSAVMTAPSAGSFTPVTTTTGALPLSTGQQYVLFLTTVGVPNVVGAVGYGWGLTSANPYSGGQFVFDGFAPDPTTSLWLDFGLRDLAFMAVFGPAGLVVDGLNPNQTAIAQNINGAIADGGSPDFAPLAMTLMGLPAGQLPGALDQLSPEIYNY
jgi:hypothetical protein